MSARRYPGGTDVGFGPESGHHPRIETVVRRPSPHPIANSALTPAPPAFAPPAALTHAGPVCAASGYYRVRFAADPVQLIFLRAGLDVWLQRLQWPETARVDALLAISEVCTNAIQHGYATEESGEVDVVGRLVAGPDDRRIVVVVRDEGRWGSALHGPGYGLKIVHECMADVRIRHDERGTTVTMTSRGVPLLDGAAPDAEQATEEIAAGGRRHRAPRPSRRPGTVREA